MTSAAPQRVGLFGGTFDPPHLGHLVTAVNVRHAIELDVVLMMVANVDRGDEMTQVGRIERAPEEPDPLRCRRRHEARCERPTTSTIRHSTCGIARIPGFRP